jgi:hypothetical protein
MPKFTSERRERFLTRIERGDSIEDACAVAGVGRATTTRWAARGRVPGAAPDAVEFARRVDDVRAGRNLAPLSKAALVRLLERAALRGSVQAMRLLLERPWERSDGPAPLTVGEADPFAALDGDQLAQRRRDRTPEPA